MTDAEIPDYIVRTYGTYVHTNPVAQSQLTTLSSEQMATFSQWNQNVATVSGVGDGSIAVAGTSTTGTVNNLTGRGPATSVDVSGTNMMVSQDFTNPDTVAAQNHWSWDGTDGDISPGCARVDCDGSQDDLVSNEIPVLVGEKIEVSVQVEWEAIEYTGTNPIILGVEKYRRGKDQDTGGVTYLDVGSVDVAMIESPADYGAWGQGDIAGIYIVEAGVDQLRFRFHTSCTAGVVKWDEAVFLKPDLIADNAVPGVGTTVDDIVTQLYGTAGEGFTHNDSAVALGNTAASILSLNARLSATEAESSPGSIAADDFLFTGEITADANWDGGYSLKIPKNGEYSADGSDAVWQKFTTSLTPSQRCWFSWVGTGATSTTDYQLVRLLLSSAPMTHSAGFRSWIHLLGRISAGFGQYVRAAFCSDGTYFVDYWNGSAFVVMNSGTCAVPGTGALLSLYCGDQTATAPRHYKLMSNQTKIAEFDDSSGASPLGVDNRKWGWGAQVESGYFINVIVGDIGQGTPPKVNQWLGYDQ
jgi:hypothetical protein